MVPELNRGSTYPPYSVDDVTDAQAVRVVCDPGYAPEKDMVDEYTCSDFNVLANVANFCQGKTFMICISIIFSKFSD